MKKITALGAALSLSLLFSSAVFGGEILTPGIAPPSPTPIVSSSGQEIPITPEPDEEVLTGIELLYYLLGLVR
ncbi:MAG: hypothetical protein ABR501_00280 [Pyrinomonadaceae bacterium]